MKDQASITIIVATCCGSIYVKLVHWAEGGKCRIVVVAELREFQGRKLAAHCQIPLERQFRELRELTQLPRLTDAVIAAIQDREHTEPAPAFLRAGYHLLLEKPMAPIAKECRTIVEVARKNQRIVAGSHSLHYPPDFRKLREFLQSGVIGDLVCFRHFEGMFYWYQAHPHDFAEAGLNRALREGSYECCVYTCDNDMMDHQTVNFRFDNDVL